MFSAFLGLSIALTLVADFGIGTWLLRELSGHYARSSSDDAHNVGHIVSAGVFVNIAIAAPLVVAALAWVLATNPGLGESIALVALLAYGALSASANALESCLRARRKVRLVFLSSLLEKGALIVLLLAVVAIDAGLGAVGVAYLAAGFVRLALAAYIVFARHDVPLVAPSVRGSLRVARSSLPFALNAASFNLVPRLDTLVLIALSATSAAWFAIGERALGPALLIPATLGSTLYPFMAHESARHVAPWKLAGALGVAGAALAGLGIVLAPSLVPLVFGEAYEDSVPVVQVMLLVVPFVYATSTLLVVAYSHGHERTLLIPGLVLSFAGTLAIVAGQIAGGPTLAAVGFVARSALFLVVVGTIAVVVWKRQAALPTSTDTAEDPPPPRPFTAPTR